MKTVAQAICHPPRGPLWENNPWRSLTGAIGWTLIAVGSLVFAAVGAFMVWPLAEWLGVAGGIAVLAFIAGVMLLWISRFPGQSRIRPARRYVP